MTPAPDQVEVIDAGGLMVLPGLIDIHVHGGAGCDMMDATSESLMRMSTFFVQHGVTEFLPTTITYSSEATHRAIENVLQNKTGVAGARPLGIHLEGPYLSQAYRGAQPSEFIRIPDPNEYHRWFESGIIRRITVAPELPGALELIRDGLSRGVRFSAGHTGASYVQIEQAADEGLSQSTHTFNGMLGLHHREPGALGAFLTDDRIACEVIADGVHVHPAMLRLLVRAKGVERTVLVTDAIRAAGIQDGSYDLGGQPVTVREGIARTVAGSLAGSTLTLERAVRNMMRMGGMTINQAVAMATTSPAAAVGFEGQKGEIKPGGDADIILIDSDFNVRLSMIAGRVVYRSTSG
jgi:N-acetylglucosamine-6-phosphate deacetylase